ncbi:MULTISPECIES: transglycosylase domain-containing protein [Bacillaceae]|uniref:transglycosylase domain-containing protein n=1 Tax=Bacillales TaxID=1385 RepID=UPI0024B37460|nr:MULTISPECIES: transglycosylase domain-containing protein [Bacillaceae]MDO6656185.1 transglycosylase domain-containing protein [Anaerobacillus sp. 1_MG-2023]
MRELFSSIRQKWNAFIDRLQEYNILTGSRIAYKVTWNLFLIFIVLGLMGTIFAGGVGAGYFASLVKDEPIRSYDEMKRDVYNYEETSEVYFAGDVLLGNFRSDIERKEVELKNVSPLLQKAVISTEDEYFFDHDGIVPKAIGRAVLQEVTNSDDRSGGSTLTQQLVKNQILTREVSFERKAKEMLLALRLENFFNKEEILEAYLNIVPYGRNASGNNIAGVQAASQGIFGVNASDLNLPQAAFIAGIPKNPYTYTPFTNSGEVKKDLSAGIDRMEFVLYRMYEEETITEEEYNKALEYDIEKNLAESSPSPVEKYPYLTFEIEDRAKRVLAEQIANEEGYDGKELSKSVDYYNQITYDANVTGRSATEIAKKMDLKWEEVQENSDVFLEFMSNAEKELRKNGYKIYTTIDKDIYESMNAARDKVLENGSYFQSAKTLSVQNPETGELENKEFPMQVGSILIENESGKILSFVGGRDFAQEELNHATDAYRSNGSTMKPLLDYAPAMEMGKVQPGYIVPDLPIQDGYNPGNYSSNYHGLVTARKALERSYNVPAVRVYNKMNPVDATDYLVKMGFSTMTLDDRTNPSMAIGALQRGVSVEENTNAFGTFANGGKFVDAYLIDKIVDRDGNTIFEQKPEPVDVFSPQTAYLSIDMMRDVVNQGTAQDIPGKLKFASDWAGKTGTGQNYYDSWFVAVNPNVSLGVWTGYDKQISMDSQYANRNKNLWALFANAAYDKKPEIMDPEESFKMPTGIVRRSFCGISGKLASDLCQKAGLVKTDLFNAKYVPTEVDDSLTQGRYVIMNGKTYQALSSTPEEFVSSGVMIKEDYFSGVDISQLLPSGFSDLNIVSEGKTASENGKKPGAVGGVSISGSSLNWGASGESDIVGYRIYRASNGSSSFTKLGSVKASDGSSFNIPSGAYAYYVTAVDVAGNESGPSAKVTNGDWSDKPEPKPEKKQEAEPSTDEENDEASDNEENENNAPSDNESDESSNSEDSSSNEGNTNTGENANDNNSNNSGNGNNNGNSSPTNGAESGNNSNSTGGNTSNNDQ